MPTVDELLQQMDVLVSALVENAKRLKEACEKSVAEEELEHFQGTQDRILRELHELDALIVGEGAPTSATIRKNIHHKLQEFQKINNEFVHRLHGRLSLIHFFGAQEGV